MDRRNLSPIIRMLAISQVVLACSLNPDVTEAPPVTEPPPTTAIPETDDPAVSETSPADEKPYPLVGNSLIRHRLHLFVPQPE